jgi:WD40 repeat protein/energy-coupling factor transporter ATP-binding protein EcfA2
MSEKSINIRPNPFPGLRAYRPDEGHLFFGRLESIVKVVTRLKENRFVSVIGASGSGKSSLVLSGVIPALLRENAEGKKSWSYIVFRPERNPVDNLAKEIAALSASAGFTQVPVSNVAASLHNRSEGIIDIVNKIRKNLRQQIVIVIDQFEEIFRYSPISTRGTLGDDATDLIDLLVNAVRQPDQGLYIIFTLRSEYVSECSRFHSLTNLMNSSSFLLPQMSHDMLSMVIEEPVKVSGATIDRSLVRIILGDLPDRPGQLPVLQHLLMRLWNQWSKVGDMSRPIGIADYEAIGQLRGAISQHAGQALESLDERHRYVCARLFRTITVRAEDGRELRKPENVSTIAARTGCAAEEIIHVAEVFRAPEYSFITPSKEIPLDENSIIDLTHESIIKNWNTLRKWIDDEEASGKLYKQLAAAAEQYQQGNGKLWTAPDLQIAIRWREENNPTLAWAEKIDPAFERTMLFLKNSEEEYAALEEYNRKSGTKKIKRSRLIAGLLGMMTLLTLVALGVAFSLKNKAEQQKSVALQLKNEAEVYNSILGDSLRLLSDTLRSMGQETRVEKTVALAAANRAAEAEVRASSAGRRLREANAEKTSAVIRAEKENRLKMLSVARSLAVRSLNHQGDKDIQILLAWQAFLFNDRYSGVADDADIFAALYEVSKQYGNRYYTQFRPEGATLTAMAQESNGKFFYTADTKGRVLRWQTAQPGQGYKLLWSGDNLINTMSVSPDETWLACGTENIGIIVIPLKDDTVFFQLQDSVSSITALVFSASGNHLYASGPEGTVSEWNLKLRQNRKIGQSMSGFSDLEISSDNSLLAGLTNDGKILLLDTGSAYKQTYIEEKNKVLTSMKFISGGKKLATGDDTGVIDIWNLDGQNIEASIEAHMSAIAELAFDSKYCQMLSADVNGEIKLWSMSDLIQPPAVISDSNKDIIAMAYDEEGNAFLTATPDLVTERPAHVRCMTDGLCAKVTRNLSSQEWSAFVGRDIEYEPACPDKPFKIVVREIRGSR